MIGLYGYQIRYRGKRLPIFGLVLGGDEMGAGMSALAKQKPRRLMKYGKRSCKVRLLIGIGA